MNTQKKVPTQSESDRRLRNSYNLFFTTIFIFLFILIFINKLILLNVDNKIDDLTLKFDKYFGPIEEVQLPEWEENP
jgi:hypothetical protein